MASLPGPDVVAENKLRKATINLFQLGSTPLIQGKRKLFESSLSGTAHQMIYGGVDKNNFETIRFIKINKFIKHPDKSAGGENIYVHDDDEKKARFFFNTPKRTYNKKVMDSPTDNFIHDEQEKEIQRLTTLAKPYTIEQAEDFVAKDLTESEEIRRRYIDVDEPATPVFNSEGLAETTKDDSGNTYQTLFHKPTSTKILQRVHDGDYKYVLKKDVAPWQKIKWDGMDFDEKFNVLKEFGDLNVFNDDTLSKFLSERVKDAENNYNNTFNPFATMFRDGLLEPNPNPSKHLYINYTDPKRSSDAIKIFSLEFKKNYSWFTGRKMHRKAYYSDKFFKETETSHDVVEAKIELRLTGNEDEHVLPFGFMLIFGGGIGQAPELQSLKDIINPNNLRIPRREKKAIADLIESMGVDFRIISNYFSYKPAVELAIQCMGMSWTGYAEFCINMHKIIYWGYFLSEGKPNSMKSDHLFIKYSRTTQGTYKFSPADDRIKIFLHCLFLYSQSINYDKAVELENALEQFKNLPHESRTEQEHLNSFYNRNKQKYRLLPRGWRISEPGSWDTNYAFNNMKYILQKCCDYLNNFTDERIFFNIVLSGIFLNDVEKKIKTVVPTTSTWSNSITKLAGEVLQAQSPTQSPFELRKNPSIKRGTGTFTNEPMEGNPLIEKQYFNAFLKKYPHVTEKLRTLTPGPLRDRIAELGFYDSHHHGGKRKKKTRKKRRRKKKKRTRRKK